MNNSTELNYPVPNYNVHVFYYPWYGTPEFDGKYLHWNHEYLLHWDKKEAAKWPKGRHKPPEDIGSNFYPELGPYSSRDPAVLSNHMEQIRTAGAGVLAVSWYPPGQADAQGRSWDDMVPKLMDAAHKYKLKVCFHIEPFENRNALTVKNAIHHIITTHGNHPAFYRRRVNNIELPLYYIYDSYLLASRDWTPLLTKDGYMSVRGTEDDGLFIGLLVEERHKRHIVDLVLMASTHTLAVTVLVLDLRPEIGALWQFGPTLKPLCLYQV